MPNEITAYLKYANLQIAAEAFYGKKRAAPGEPFSGPLVAMQGKGDRRCIRAALRDGLPKRTGPGDRRELALRKRQGSPNAIRDLTAWRGQAAARVRPNRANAMTHLPKWVGGKLETFGYPSCRKNNFRGWSMCAREFFKAGECPPHGAGEFEGCCLTAIAAHGLGGANGGRIAADISSRLGFGNLQSGARPLSAVLRTMVTVLSLSLPVVARAQGVALGNLFTGSDALPYFWLPLLGCIGIIISMLYDAHSQRILRKGLGRCAVVVLAAFIVAVCAFLNGLPFELVLLAIAPWTCFLVLLWGFVTSALGDWDRS